MMNMGLAEACIVAMLPRASKADPQNARKALISRLRQLPLSSRSKFSSDGTAHSEWETLRFGTHGPRIKVIREGNHLWRKGYEVGHFDHYWRVVALLAFRGRGSNSIEDPAVKYLRKGLLPHTDDNLI